MNGNDDKLDALIRAATETPVNVGRMQARLTSAIARPTPTGAWGAAPGRAVLAGLALALVLTPLVVARLAPGTLDEDVLAGLSLGEVGALGILEIAE